MVDVKNIKLPLPLAIGLCVYVGAQFAGYGVLVYKVDQLIAATTADKVENKEKFERHDNQLVDLRAQAAIHNTRITVLEQTFKR